MKTMKTCKMGCGKMKSGGPVKKIKMAKGGSSGCPPGQYWSVQGCQDKAPGYKGPLSSLGAKLGIGVPLAGGAAMIGKAITKGIKNRKENKKEAEETVATLNKLNVKRKGGAIKKYAAGGQIYGMPQENLGTSGQYGFAKRGGIMKKKSGGPLKPVPADKVGLSKLPTAVRNKMGYMKKGGVKKK